MSTLDIEAVVNMRLNFQYEGHTFNPDNEPQLQSVRSHPIQKMLPQQHQDQDKLTTYRFGQLSLDEEEPSAAVADNDDDDVLSTVSSDFSILSQLSQHSSGHYAGASLPFVHFEGSVASLGELPNELLVHILIYLNGPQIVKMECLSRRFYQLIHHEDESERKYNKLIRRKKIPSKEKRREQRRLSINLATMIASSGLELNAITSGYDFWIFLNEVQYRDETQRRRREFASSIQPRIFYMYQHRIVLLNEKYSVEKALRSLEDALTSHPYFNEVCVFSPYLLYLYYMLYRLDKDYAMVEMKYHAFEEYKVDVDNLIAPIARHVLEKEANRNGQGNMKMIAIVKLAPTDVLKKPVQQETLSKEELARQLILEAYENDFKDDRNVSTLKFIHEMNPTHDKYKYNLDDQEREEKGGKVTHAMNSIYRSWMSRWKDVINTKREYHSFIGYNPFEMEAISIRSGFSYENDLRMANAWLKREQIYSKLLQRQLH